MSDDPHSQDHVYGQQPPQFPQEQRPPQGHPLEQTQNVQYEQPTEAVVISKVHVEVS